MLQWTDYGFYLVLVQIWLLFLWGGLLLDDSILQANIALMLRGAVTFFCVYKCKLPKKTRPRHSP